MKRKKELIIIIFVVFITILLALLPSIISCNKRTDINITTKKDDDNIINITLKGELNIPIQSDINIGSYTNTITLEFLSGVSYREIEDIVYNSYRTKYTIFNSNYSIFYYEDTTIYFESSYVSNYEITITSTESNDYININTASKELLKTLYGIGEARAELIISYRKDKKIETFDELKSLIGVSDEVIECIKEKAIL